MRYLPIFLILVAQVFGFVIDDATTDQEVPFVAVDATDGITRESGITTGWSVSYSLNGGTWTAMTTPTIAENGTTGSYWLLVDESGMTTLTSGDYNSNLYIEISHADIATVPLSIDVKDAASSGGGITESQARGAAGTTYVTLEAGSTSTVIQISALDPITAPANDAFIGCAFIMMDGTYQGSSSIITDFVDNTGGHWDITVSPALTGAPATASHGLIAPAGTNDWNNGGRLDNILDSKASQTSVDGLNDITSGDVQAACITAIEERVGTAYGTVGSSSTTTVINISAIDSALYGNGSVAGAFDNWTLMDVGNANPGWATRVVSSTYDGSWHLTVDPAFASPPNSGYNMLLLPDSSNYMPALTYGNLEDMFDGTGYSNSTAPATQGALATHDTALTTHNSALGTHDTDLKADITALNDLSGSEVQAEAEDAIESLLGVCKLNLATGSTQSYIKVDSITGGPGWYSTSSNDIFIGAYIVGVAQSNSGVLARITDSSYSTGEWTFYVKPDLRDVPGSSDFFLMIPSFKNDLISHNTLLTNHTSALNTHDLDIKSNQSIHNAALSTHDSALTTHDTALGTHDSALTTHDAALTNHNTALSTHTVALATHDTALTTHDSALGTHDTDIAGDIAALNDFDAANDPVANVTDVTNTVAADTVAISGDTTAADNMEATYDGTGYSDPHAPSKQSQLENIANTGAAINVVADGATLNAGTEGATDYTDTQQLNLVYHEVDHAAGAIDVEYTFDITGVGVPVSFTATGRLYDPPVTNDTLPLYAWDYVGSGWSQIGTIVGTAGTTDVTNTVTLFSNHVGTGVNSGEVKIRMAGTGLGIGTRVELDLAYVSYSVVSSAVGYANGKIWIDTLNGTAGAVPNRNGVADLPVDNWADAVTLSGLTGLTNFTVNQGSLITLSATTSNYGFAGLDYILDLSDEQVDNCTFLGAVVTGVATGNGGSLLFEKCKFGNITLPEAALVGSAFAGTITFGEGGTYFFENCSSAIAGNSAPVIDFGTAVGDVNLNVRHYSGGLDIRNMGPGDTMSLEGHGQLILNANCTGGAISLRGHFAMTDDTDGLVLLSDDANFKSTVIHAGVAQASTVNTITLSARASTADGAYDPSMIMIVTGTGAGQTRLVYQYDGTTRIAAVDRNWKVAPDTTSEYRVLANPGREHVNEGLAQGGTTTSITLNALASDFDSAYSGQTVFLRSGQGEDQSALVASYNGTTKVATIEGTWPDGTPDATTGYVMLSTHVHTKAEIADAVHDEVIEGGFTSRQLQRIGSAYVAGKLVISGGVYTYTGVDGVTTRIVAPVNASGHTLTTLDGN